MIARLLSAALLAGCLAGCGGSLQPQPQPTMTQAAAPLVPCDDGGSGGVMIDGVCL